MIKEDSCELWLPLPRRCKHPRRCCQGGPPPGLQVWRAWIKEGSRKQRVPGGCVAEAPPQLAQALQGVMCECHGRLLNYEVPAVVHR